MTAIWDAAVYDAPRRRLVPGFDDFYGQAAALVAELGLDAPEVLDLGTGTGILSSAVRAAVADARLTVVDGDTDMLSRAVERVAPSVALQQDLRDPLPPGPFDAIVSALAIHHLAHDEVRDLYRRCREALRSPGVFVNAEQVAAPDPWLEERQSRAWERAARSLGSDDDEINAARTRMLADRCAPVAEHLDWLHDPGFAHTDCVWRGTMFAVLAAW